MQTHLHRFWIQPWIFKQTFSDRVALKHIPREREELSFILPLDGENRVR